MRQSPEHPFAGDSLWALGITGLVHPGMKRSGVQLIGWQKLTHGFEHFADFDEKLSMVRAQLRT